MAHATARRLPRLGDARRHPRRPARLRAVLPARLLPRATRSRSSRSGSGGMSFHGGLLGVVAGDRRCSRRQRGISILALGDIVAAAVPIGLFFGRIANFINGELWGRADRRALGDGVPARRAGSRAIRASSTRPASKASLLFLVLACWRTALGVRRRPASSPASSSSATRSRASSSSSSASRTRSSASSSAGLTMGQLLSPADAASPASG